MTLKTLRLSSTGAQVAFRDQGQGDPLILLHGVGMQSAAWGPQINALSKDRRVIALDLPGHGHSAPLPQDAPLPAFVNWCAEGVEALGLKQISIAGHSMGALIAAGFAATHPDRTSRVAVLNGVFRRDVAAREAVQQRAAQIKKGVIDLETPLSRWFGQTPVEQAARTQVARWLQQMSPTGYATAYAAFAHGDAIYADQFPQITCPLLALTGDGDPNSTPAMAQTMAAQAQHGKAVILKGHRHMANLTAPDAVNAHLTTWLNTPACTKELQ